MPTTELGRVAIVAELLIVPPKPPFRGAGKITVEVVVVVVAGVVVIEPG
jgi:hypothetical protein